MMKILVEDLTPTSVQLVRLEVGMTMQELQDLSLALRRVVNNGGGDNSPPIAAFLDALNEGRKVAHI